MDFGTRARKTAENYVAYRTQSGAGFSPGFGREPQVDGEDSGTYSPTLWKRTSGKPGMVLSPTSSTRAILQGQMELMEMVRSLPESYYELSLRDIVEAPSKLNDGAPKDRMDDVPEEKSISRSGSRKQMKSGSKRYVDAKAQIVRKTSIKNGGVLLKMVFPGSSLGSKQKKRNSSSPALNNSPKVSPRPSISERPAKVSIKDRWKKFSTSGKVDHGILDSDSGSSKSSNNSRNNSNNDRNRRHDPSIGCWPFSRKKKAVLPK